MNIKNQLADVRHKIHTVKENINWRFKNPKSILVILSMREAQLEDQVYSLTH